MFKSHILKSHLLNVAKKVGFYLTDWMVLKQKSFLQDLIQLYFCFFCQIIVVPHHPVVGPFFDILTPWLVQLFVRARIPYALFFYFIASLLAETHSSISAGTYFCTYWIIGFIVVSLRSSIEWENPFPWWVFFMVSELWVMVAEAFVFSTRVEWSLFWSWNYFLVEIIRILASTALGIYFVGCYSASAEKRRASL